MDASITLNDRGSREPVVAVVFAGGAGTRMGAAMPKQFLELNGKPVLAHVLELFERQPEVDRIRLVVQKEYISAAESLCREYGIGKLAGICEGGASAQESIYRGLLACREGGDGDDAIVLLHDGVRPYVLPEVISANIAGVRERGNAVTFTPCFETLVISEDGQRVSDIPPRRKSYAAQAPQSFRLGDILAAHERVRAMPGGYEDLVDQATICWKLGIPINLVPGNRGNVKITTPEDIISLEALLRREGGR